MEACVLESRGDYDAFSKKERERKKKKKRKRLLSFAFSSAIKFRYLDSYRKLPKSSLGRTLSSPVTCPVWLTSGSHCHKQGSCLIVCFWLYFFCLCNGYAEPFLPRYDVCNIKYMFFKGHNNQEKQILIFFLFLCP